MRPRKPSISASVQSEHLALIYAAQAGDEAAMQALLKNHAGLIRHFARQLHRGKAFLELDDLIQVGSIGFMRAVERFKERRRGKQTSLATYAGYWIKHYMTREIQNHGNTIRIPAGKRRSGLDPKSSQLEAVRRISLDDEKIDPRLEYLLSRVERPLSTPPHSLDRLHIKNLLHQLSRREQIVIAGLFAVHGVEHPRSTDDLARELGVSRGRVNKIKKRALEKLTSLQAGPKTMKSTPPRNWVPMTRLVIDRLPPEIHDADNSSDKK